MTKLDYKIKYQDLKVKFLDAVDVAFRLGYEQGAQQATMQAAQQQQQVQQEQQAQAQAQGQPGMGPGEQAPSANSESPEAEQQEADQPPGTTSEIDQHIQTLESMLGKSELSESHAQTLRKSIESLKSFSDNRKIQKSIKAIAKNINKPAFKFSKSAEHNLNPNQKQALSLQEKIVSDMFKSWEEEERKGTSSILQQLSTQGLIKG